MKTQYSEKRTVEGGSMSGRVSASKTPMQFGRVITLFLLVFALIALGACGEKRRGYRAANTYDGCMRQCEEANQCGGAGLGCYSCSIFMLEQMGFYHLSKDERACMNGMGEYYACVSDACVLDENGDPYYSEEGIEECEPIADKYEAVCDRIDDED